MNNKIAQANQAFEQSHRLNSRRCGKTHALATRAKEIGAVLVCYNQQHAKIITKDYGCETISGESTEKLCMLNKPVLFDPDLIFKYLGNTLDEVKYYSNKCKEVEGILNIALDRIKDKR